MRSSERSPAHGGEALGPADAAVPGAPPRPRARVLVCTTCRGADGSDARPRPGERLLADAARLAASSCDAAELQGAAGLRDPAGPCGAGETTGADDGAAVSVSGVECLGNCKRRLSAAVLVPGAWAYVFGDLDETAGADLLAGARLLAAAPDGLMPWRGRPDALKRGLVARIPPVTLPAASDTP